MVQEGLGAMAPHPVTKRTMPGRELDYTGVGDSESWGG